jgi:hypothetical protein
VVELGTGNLAASPGDFGFFANFRLVMSLEGSASQPEFAAHALHLLGEVATHPEWFDAESGEDYYRQALALAGPRGMRPLIAHCHLGLGSLYRRTGKGEEAREHLATATRMYREMDMGFWLVQAEGETRAAGLHAGR